MTIEQLEQILKESKSLAIPAVEKNIFSIGGRGHYENPISDLLAFFMDLHEIHGLGDLVLRSIYEAIGLPTNDTDLITPPQREVCTDDEKRIDILAEGESYVTVIENKIRHWAANPFDSYDDYLDKYYKTKSKYKILLSIRNEVPPAGWYSLTYKDLLSRIKANLGECVVTVPYSKWLILFREFLMNIEQEYETGIMNNDRFEFAKQNYQAIRDLQKIADDYINELQRKSLDVIRTPADIDESDVFANRNNWGEDGIAIRLHHKKWGGKSNITFLVTPTGLFRVQFYVHDIPDSDASTLRDKVNDGKYKKFWTEQKTIRCFGFLDSSDLDVVLAAIQNVAQKLNAYYGKV